MNPLQIIGWGLGWVFLTLGVLTAGTYLLSWIIDGFFTSSDKGTETEKIAAIVAALDQRREG
ncbi:MAG: OadG family protein [Candidatus Acetothermia bacterium]